ncbi:peptide-methionine (S)-S-oxide reductase MsrA [Reinekea sp.]|jgi:peptide-methionine (S)-S-oxide reductase|uniref:peptide-methionine (S)-S-oxide reductase MsrA n=1 Tax=Reinekea sp. TaxID=1970455 RepID=UPI003989F72F
MTKLASLLDDIDVIPDRATAMQLDYHHSVFQIDMRHVPENAQQIWLAAGCFWGVERLFWQLEGVLNTAVGYAGGKTKNPSYYDVCSGRTGHTEIVQVVFQPDQISLAQLLKVFWEAHDPTQGMKQGNDIGTQYRSAIYASEALLAEIEGSKARYQTQLTAQGFGEITTEINTEQPFYFAEEEHQQYLFKNPAGYCGLKGTGAVCPI